MKAAEVALRRLLNTRSKQSARLRGLAYWDRAESKQERREIAKNVSRLDTTIRAMSESLGAGDFDAEKGSA